MEKKCCIRSYRRRKKSNIVNFYLLSITTKMKYLSILFSLSVLLFGSFVSAEDTWVPPKYFTCKSALYWSATWKNNSKSEKWHATSDVAGVPGKSKEAALVFAHEVHIVSLKLHDLKGAKSTNFSNRTGACWTDTKPGEPLGWPKHLAW